MRCRNMARRLIRSRSVREEEAFPLPPPTVSSASRPRKKTIGLLALCFVFFWVHAIGALDVDEFEKLVRQWLDLRRESSQVKNEWKQQQGLLSDEMRMLERQKVQLVTTVEAQRSRVNALEKELGEAERIRDGHASSLEKLTPSLIQAERFLKPWEQALPIFMLQPIHESFKKLPQSRDPENPSSLAQRFRNVLSLYSELEQLNCSVHAEKLILKDPEGKEQEMDVIFFGLCVGFAVSPDNLRGAVGHIMSEGMAWEWDPSLAASIRRAWSCYQKEKPAAFVQFPMTLEETAK